MGNPILSTLTRPQLEDLVVDLSKRWLAHDGLWFQAVEADQGMSAAMGYDATAWSAFTVIEAKRIMAFLGLAPGGDWRPWSGRCRCVCTASSTSSR